MAHFVFITTGAWVIAGTGTIWEFGMERILSTPLHHPACLVNYYRLLGKTEAAYAGSQ